MANASASMIQMPTDVRSATARQFRLIYVLGFAYFLMVAIALRFLPKSRRPSLPGLAGNRSVIGEARALTSTFIPFAFTR
jgi:light-harvesting complex 1 beta chain